MEGEPKDFYVLLGVERSASTREIRRAYRRRLVISHRERVLDLTDHLEHLRRAYTTLRDPALRNDYDIAGRVAPQSRAPRATSKPSDRAREEGNARLKIAQEIAGHSQRLGTAALEKSADAVNRLAGEHDERESADARRRARRALLLRLAKIVVFVLFAGAAFWVAQRLSGRG